MPANPVWMVRGRPILAAASEDRLHGISQGDARLQVERDGDCREQALMVDRQRRRGRAETARARSTEPAVRAGDRT